MRLFGLLAIPAGLALALCEPAYHAISELLGGGRIMRYMGHTVLAGFPAAALLCGRGAELLRASGGTRTRRGEKSWLAIAAGLALLLWSPLGSTAVAWAAPPDVMEGGHLLRIRILFTLTVAFLAVSRVLFRSRFPFIPALLAADYLIALHGFEAKAPASAFTPPRILEKRALHEGRVFCPPWIVQVFPDAGVPQVEHYRARYWLLSPNIPQLFGLRNACGYEPFCLASHRELFGTWEENLSGMQEAFRSTGVRWMIGPLNRAMPGWIKREDILPGWALWENPSPAGLTAVIMPGAASAARIPWRSLSGMADAGTSRLEFESFNDAVIKVEAARPALLRVSVLWFPGWQAFVNGARVPIARAGGMFLAAPVPAGRSRVVLSYSPLSFKVGLLLSSTVLACLAWLGLLFLLDGPGRASPAASGTNARGPGTSLS